MYQCERKDTKVKYAAKIIQTKSQKNMEESLNEVGSAAYGQRKSGIFVVTFYEMFYTFGIHFRWRFYVLWTT